MKLSYTQFREVYGDLGVTVWTKYLKGEYPTLYRITNDNEGSKSYTILEIGKTYEFEVISPYALTGNDDTNYRIILNGMTYLRMNSGVKTKITIQSNYTGELVAKNNYANKPMELVIRKVVDNLVEGCTTTNATLIEHKSNDINDYRYSVLSVYGYIGKRSYYNLEYGTYRFHCDINEAPNLLKVYGYIRNVSKSIVIAQNHSNTDTRDFTFTLDESNFRKGDEISFQVFYEDASGIVDISNFYVCKIDWIATNAGDIDYDLESNTYGKYIYYKDNILAYKGAECALSGYTYTYDAGYYATFDKCITNSTGNNKVYIQDWKYDSDVAAFKSAMTNYTLWSKADSESNNSAHKKVDLGTLDWTYQGGSSPYFYNQTLSDWSTVTKAAISWYTTTNQWSTFITLDKGIFISGDNLLRIRNTDYTDATTFKSAMSGVYLYYQ